MKQELLYSLSFGTTGAIFLTWFYAHLEGWLRSYLP
jgi:hypothetical protein